MGIGVAVMHYSGMEAMGFSGEMYYKKRLFFASILIAIVAATVALSLIILFGKNDQVTNLKYKISAAILMGLAVCGMHYTGMEATVFLSKGPVSLDLESTAGVPIIIFSILGIILLILVVAIIASITRGEFNNLQIKKGELEVLVEKRTTELKALASLSGENTSPVFRVNSENILLYSNSAGLIFLNHFNSKQGEKIPKPFLEILNQAGTKEEVNKIEVKQDNETFEFDIVYVTEMNYFNIYGHNITKRKIAENNIILAKNAAEKANHAKTEFLTHISHELRTPMNAILGFTDLMSRDSINPLPIHQKDKLDQVTSSGKHLLKLINEMLDLSAVESGNLKILIEATDLIPIVDDVISTCQALAFKNGIILEHEKFSSDEIIVDVDSNRMKQVVLNLIANAIKYNKPNGKVIVSYLKQKNSQIRLGVKDTGYGISEDNKEKIFKPFQRLDVGSKNIEGAGIGLTISKQLIELMSGKIGFESTRDKGSYFYIDLQLSNNTLPKKEIINSIKLQTDNVKTSDLKKILYIEDNEVNINLVGHILSLRKNIIYLSTTKAMAGIELAKSELPELILLDLRLPDMDGITAFKELKSIKETANIPVIALTANAIDGEAEKALTIGFKNYITKPLDIEKFLNIIDKVLV
jgi:signal transduction histidine kinase